MRLFTVLSLGGAPESTLPNISTRSRHFEAFAAAMRIVTSGKRSPAPALFWSPWAHRIFTSQSSDMTRSGAFDAEFSVCCCCCCCCCCFRAQELCEQGGGPGFSFPFPFPFTESVPNWQSCKLCRFRRRRGHEKKCWCWFCPHRCGRGRGARLFSSFSPPPPHRHPPTPPPPPPFFFF